MGSGWRIVPARRAQTAFTGEGPWRYGGRWNSPGLRVVYVSEHQSTAAFEVFANQMPFILEGEYKAFYAEWPDSLTERFASERLPANWRIHPPDRSKADRRPLGQRAALRGTRSPERRQPRRYEFSAESAASGFQAHLYCATDRFRVRLAPAESLTTLSNACSRGRCPRLVRGTVGWNNSARRRPLKVEQYEATGVEESVSDDHQPKIATGNKN